MQYFLRKGVARSTAVYQQIAKYRHSIVNTKHKVQDALWLREENL